MGVQVEVVEELVVLNKNLIHKMEVMDLPEEELVV